MPHLVILYTGNLDAVTDMTVLCRSLANTMLTLRDDTGKPVSHPQVPQFFKELKRGHYVSRARAIH